MKHALACLLLAACLTALCAGCSFSPQGTPPTEPVDVTAMPDPHNACANAKSHAGTHAYTNAKPDSQPYAGTHGLSERGLPAYAQEPAHV